MFRTELNINSKKEKIVLNNSITTIGSCFSDAIGNKLYQNKFTVSVNPFGTSYNPISIHRLLAMACQNSTPQVNSYLEQNGVHANYQFHSTFSSLTREAIEEQVSKAIAAAHQNLQTTSIVIITYGTAWVYERNDIGEIVNNCHKVPNSNFTKKLLEVEHVINDFEALKNQLSLLNPQIQFILTLSPVRHIKDTLELNTVSKSILRQAIYRIVERHKNVSYFPAYEIMMDDLRDYRFYKSDMLHPTEEAEEYIWQKFTECYFDISALGFLSKWKEVRSAMAHKAFHPQSQVHQDFLKSTLQKINELKDLVNVEQEVSTLKSQIINLKL